MSLPADVESGGRPSRARPNLHRAAESDRARHVAPGEGAQRRARSAALLVHLDERPGAEAGRSFAALPPSAPGCTRPRPFARGAMQRGNRFAPPGPRARSPSRHGAGIADSPEAGAVWLKVRRSWRSRKAPPRAPVQAQARAPRASARAAWGLIGRPSRSVVALTDGQGHEGRRGVDQRADRRGSLARHCSRGNADLVAPDQPAAPASLLTERSAPLDWPGASPHPPRTSVAGALQQ